MPVNPLPILIPLLIVWAVIAICLFRWRRWAGGLFLGLSVTVLAINVLNRGVEEKVSVEMSWHLAPLDNPQPQLTQTLVVLYFKRNPHNYIGLYSDQVANYLRSLSSNDVTVVFHVTKDFGTVRGFHAVQIGELTSWNEVGEYGYAGTSGNSSEEPSSWP